MLRFTMTTLMLVILLGLALAEGGVWPLVALFYITVFTYCMDKLGTLASVDDPTKEFPAGTTLSITLGISHFILLFWGVYGLSSDTFLDMFDKVLIFLSLSLFLGQISNANAHDLIHRPARSMQYLGTAIYCSLLFGHHVSAHRRVHHVYAATDLDPNSARLDEGFYHFALRAWVGSFKAGWRAETELRQKAANVTDWHPYRTYALGAAATLGMAALIGGLAGIAVLLGLAAYAQVQLLLSDYVQHYGLRRQKLSTGKWEPIGPQHSWNAPNWFSEALMLNAPRHSDHHIHPMRAFPHLQVDHTAMPILPYSLPFMAVLALAPPFWRNVMTPRAKAWSASSFQPMST